MPERKQIFVTGATGFLGSHLTCKLLEQGHHVHALARSSKAGSARDRVVDTIRDVAGSEETARPLIERLEVVEGDISQPALGMTDSVARDLAAISDEVWHCAASLSFAEEDREEIFRMNVGGTEQLLRFVGQTRGRRLQHVSTAYVAGNRPDLAKETDIHVGQTFKNPYEESKCRSELMVAEAHRSGAIRASVYRPSIVVGDSKSGRTTHFHGVYAFMRGLFTALSRMRRGQPEDAVVRLPLRVKGSKEGTLNFVPIDFVVDGMVHIAASDSSIGQTYNLTNPTPTANMLWLPTICRVMHVEGIEIVEASSFEKEPMTKLEMLFQKQMSFYYQYIQGEPTFDCSNTVNALAGTGIECPRTTVALIEKMTGWYVNHLKAGKN